jgi:N-acetylmuramoyl-L-alanine amidase
MKRVVLLSVMSIVLVWGCRNQSEMVIIQNPIQFDSTRTALSLEYLEDRYGITQKSPSISPQMVVVHWTAIPTFKKSFDFFYGSQLDISREDIEEASTLNVSAHYLVKRNGEIHQLLPDTVFARHVIGLNHTAIGIENVGSKSKRLTDAQLKANTQLVKHLAEKHDIDYLIGHYEYPLFEGHELWKERDDGYRTEKIDPGEDFMQNLRDNLQDLTLKGPSSEELRGNQ